MKKIIRKILDIAAPKIIGDVTYLDFLCRRGIIEKNDYYDYLTNIILREVIKHTSVCVDVGCHYGTILQLMMKYAPNGKFYAFEPLPHLFEHLKKEFGHHQNISIYGIALSDVEGESSFNYVVTNPAYSGFIRRRYDRPHEEDTQITVKTDLMDNLLADVTIDLIKIDVEGAELQVLRGAKEVIKRDKPFIIFEHGPGAADCYGTKPEDVYDLLHDYCGLNPNLLNRYLKKMSPLTRDEFCEQFYKGLNYYYVAYREPS
jgi:FkbM family methyltransferase